MSALTDYLESSLLNHVLRNVAYSSPSFVYVALFTANPGEALTTGGVGQFEVPNLYGYARKQVTFAAPVSGVGTCASSADVIFNTASGGSWGTVTHIAIMDSITYGSGNGLFYGPLASAKTINDGDTFRFLAGQLVASLS